MYFCLAYTSSIFESLNDSALKAVDSELDLLIRFYMKTICTCFPDFGALGKKFWKVVKHFNRSQISERHQAFQQVTINFGKQSTILIVSNKKKKE